MRTVDSPNHDEHPPGSEISLVVLHSISLPPGEYGGDSIERLFTNCLDPEAHPYFREVCGLNVSAHFLVDRDGTIYQLMPETRMARHAIGVNHLAIGVENVGDERKWPLTEAQMNRLRTLLETWASFHNN